MTPLSDPLLTAENAAPVLGDYQPSQVNTVRSTASHSLVANVVALAKTAWLFKLLSILSTVGVSARINPDTIEPLFDTGQATVSGGGSEHGGAWATEIALKQFASKGLAKESV